MPPLRLPWGFRKCQGHLVLINAIYNPVQKCNLTLSICFGFGAASLKLHGNDFFVQPPCLSLRGPSPAPPDGIHLFSLFSQGMEPGMSELRFHPKSGTHFIQWGFLLFNPWVLALTQHHPQPTLWRGFWTLARYSKEKWVSERHLICSHPSRPHGSVPDPWRLPCPVLWSFVYSFIPLGLVLKIKNHPLKSRFLVLF